MREITERIIPGKYETEMKILAHAVGSNFQVDDIIIETIYLDENKNSKFRPMLDSLRVLSVFLKYVLVGLASFGIDYSIFLTTTNIFDVHYLYAHTIARFFSAFFNFFCNKNIVFKTKKNTFYELQKYITTVFFSYLLSGVLLYFLVDMSGISKELAKPLSELSMFIINFIILNFLVFSDKK